MSNYLSNFNNLYSNLAQGAYPDASVFFPLDNLDPIDRNRLLSGNSLPFDFSKSKNHNGQHIPGGQNLPNNGIVYLQPAPTLKTVPIRTNITTPNPNGG